MNETKELATQLQAFRTAALAAGLRVVGGEFDSEASSASDFRFVLPQGNVARSLQLLKEEGWLHVRDAGSYDIKLAMWVQDPEVIALDDLVYAFEYSDDWARSMVEPVVSFINHGYCVSGVVWIDLLTAEFWIDALQEEKIVTPVLFAGSFGSAFTDNSLASQLKQILLTDA
jgi:hypothetical protein